MAINKNTHVNASVVLPIETYEVLKKQAKDNKRSVSAQMAYAIEKELKENGYGLDTKTSK